MSEIIVSKSLSPSESKRFELLEKVCMEGRTVWYMVGVSLIEIKEKRFFVSKGFEDFEQYADSIGYSKRHANQLIADASALKEFPQELRDLVKTERAARELAKIPEELRLAVAQAATKGGKAATAKDVKKATPPPIPRRVTPGKPEKPGAPVPKKKIEREIVLDGTGIEVPPECLELWNRGPEAQTLLTYLQAILSKLKKYEESAQKDDKLFCEVDFNSTVANLKQAKVDLERAIPYAVCPSCQGVLAKDCATCKERGFVSDFYWHTCVSEEIRNTRPKGWK